MDANKIQVIDDQGNEVEFEVLFTFDNEDGSKKYVLYYDPTEEESTVFASIYDDEGKLYEIEDPKEWEMIEEVFQSFMAQDEDEDGHECCGHHHGHDHECCGEHDHDHECCCEHEN
jgi:uncharacterized protein YrzB (UPF0473 family)